MSGISAFEKHDHQGCTGNVMSRADAMCKEDGLRLTPVRRRVLEILLEEHRALGAYDVLERLSEDGFGNQPPVAYRALEFLVEHGLAHKIRRLNAFAACLHPGETHTPAFFICEKCDVVAEVPEEAVRGAVQDVADRIGFQVERVNIEAVGTCPGCRAS